MRLYSRDEVELVEELGTESTEVEPGEEPVVQFSARLCQTGRNVTVRRFSQPGRKFKDAIATAKKIWCVLFSSSLFQELKHTALLLSFEGILMSFTQLDIRAMIQTLRSL